PNSRNVQSITKTRKGLKTITRYTYQNKVESQESFLNDKLHGIIKKYNNGVLIEETEYKQGLKNGSSKIYDTKGVLKLNSRFINDTLNGVMTKYSELGTVLLKENYSGGYKTGKSEMYYKSGKLSFECYYDTLSSGKKTPKQFTSVKNGRSRSWYESGYRKTEENYLKGKKNGAFKEWYENGKLKSENDYVNDARAGRQLAYFQTGKPSEDNTIEIVYDSLKKYYRAFYTGPYLKYDENGNPTVKGFYKNRKKRGKWQEFNNGKLTLDAEYKDDYLINDYKAYNSTTGKLIRMAHYKTVKLNSKDTSLMDGKSIVYYPGGAISNELLYRDGHCINSVTYYENGIISGETSIRDSLVYKTEYYQNGKTERRSLAKYDPAKDVTAQKFELLSEYYESGILKREFYDGSNMPKIKKEYNDSGLMVYRDYRISSDIGIETTFYNSGALRSENIFFSSGYRTTGMQYVEWFENGKLKRFENYGFYQLNWLSDGTFYNSFSYKNNNPNVQQDTVIDADFLNTLYASLSKSTKRKIDIGNTEGRTFSTYDDTKVKIEAFITNGKPDKLLRAYYYSGKPMIEFSLSEGLPDGPFKRFMENGIVKESGYYCQGKLCGTWIEYSLSGDTLNYYQYEKPTEKSDYDKKYLFKKEYYGAEYKGKFSKHLKSAYNYKNGKLHGMQTEYHPNGKLHYSKMMKDGTETGLVKRFWEKGNLAEEYTIDSLGNKQGARIMGYENGNFQLKANYKDNKLDGPYIYYWPNGKLRAEGTYEADNKTGEWKMYDSTGVKTKTDNYASGTKKTQDEINICNCKTDQRKIGFAPMISDLMDITRAGIWQFGFHQPITKYLGKLFYMNYQTDASRDGSNRSVSLDVISFSEIVTGIPDSNGLKLTINPCSKFQDYSRIPVSINVSARQPNETRMEINPEMLSFKFSGKLLSPQNPLVKETESWFKVAYMEYTKTGIELNKPTSVCFTPSLLTNTKALINLSSFTPCIRQSSDYPDYIQEEFLKKNKVLVKTNFTGIYNGEGSLSSYDNKDLSFPLSHVLINSTAFAGEIILDEKNVGENRTYVVSGKELTQEKVIELIGSLLNKATLFAYKKEPGKFIISFLIKMKGK
ncbi:MAG: toxin-antitoxin system YwqK family antitoxin, partial [Bacteroidia bacterium]